MDIRHRLHQIRKLSVRNLPRAVARRLTSTSRAATERLFYTPSGPRRASPSRAVRKLGLLHADVFSSSFADRFRESYPDDARALIDAGRAARDGIIDLLGSGPVDTTAFRLRDDLRMYPNRKSPHAKDLAGQGTMPWHFDVKSGVAWPPSTFFADVRWGAPGVDVKMPWELSRCQHWVTMGQAYVLTGDESLTRAFSEQLEDWIRRNPPKFGVNWACTMDVALRACNWILAWEFFEKSPLVSEFVRANLAPSLWEHGRHIVDHLEWNGELSTNHYVANLLGLSYIARALDEDAWFDFAVREITQEIMNQTRSDGFHHEASTAYHRFVLEMFLYFGWAATAPGPSDPDARVQALRGVAGAPFVERLRQMAATLLGLMDASGRVPLVGDNDSGRVHSFGKRADADMAPVSDFAALLLSDEKIRMQRPASPETAWLFGLDGTRRLSAAGLRPAAVPGLAPGESGIASLRGEKDVLVFFAQPNGTRGVGNHTHNDKLSFCLTVDRDVFFTDPGTLAYTSRPADRNEFRSTFVHNTVMIDGQEQNRVDPDRIFSLGDDAHCRMTQFKPGIRVAAEHDGYRRLTSPVVHKRTIEKMSDPLGWIVEDQLEGTGRHEVRWRFVCGSDVSVVTNGADGLRLTGQNGELDLRVHPPHLKFQIEKTRVAPAYGIQVDTWAATAVWTGQLPSRATFTMVWRPRAVPTT